MPCRLAERVVAIGVVSRLVGDDLDFTVQPFKQVVFDDRVGIAQRVGARADANRLKAIRVARIHGDGSVNKVVGVDLVIVRDTLIAPHSDGHARVVLSFEAVVIDAVVLAVERNPEIASVNTRRVVVDDRRIREPRVGRFAVRAAKLDDVIVRGQAPRPQTSSPSTTSQSPEIWIFELPLSTTPPGVCARSVIGLAEVPNPAN